MIRHASRAALLLLALLCIAVSAQETPRLQKLDFSDAIAAPVVRVVDGDTVVLMLNGEETTVRLIGVDAPESPDAQRPFEPYGREASQFLTNLLKGETVYLEYRPGGDRLDDYGRTLAYLYRAPDGLFVNLEIVRQGYGRAYTHFPFQHMEAFRFYERRAREAEKGLWAPDVGEQALAEGLSLDSVPGVYRRFEDGKVTGILTLHPDHTFDVGGKTTPQYQWEVTPEGLVISYYSARWLFRPTGSAGFAGEYTGPDEKLVGKKAWLLRGANAAFTQPAARVAAPAATQTVRQAAPRQVPQQRDVTVYITRTGTKYHWDGCRFLSKSRIPIWLQEAKRQGYTPCSVCKPPQ